MNATSLKVKCIGYSQNGSGLIDYNGKHIEVFGLMQDEIAEVSIKRVKGFLTATLIKVLEPSSDRIKPPCPYYEHCGGCQLQHMSLEAQAKYKEKIVSKALKSFAKPKPLVTMKNPDGYRNKCHYTFARGKKGEIIAGLYQTFTHKVVKIERCMIHDDRADKIVQTITKHMEPLKIFPYDEDLKSGALRHVLVRVAKGTGQVLVVLVTGSEAIPSQSKLIKILSDEHPEITTIVHNINNDETSMVLGKRERVIYGEGYIVDTLCGYQFKISAKSFYQINREQTEKLYHYAMQQAAIKSTDVVLDAYCGIGTIGIIAAKKALSVVGIEINSTSVGDAKFNAKLNKIDNIQFITGDAAELLKTDLNEVKFNTVFIDPPRAGCSKELIDALKVHQPDKIVYISCHPDSQARDIKQLGKAGYKVKKIQPFDMFVYSNHVETVVCLTKNSANK